MKLKRLDSRSLIFIIWLGVALANTCTKDPLCPLTLNEINTTTNLIKKSQIGSSDIIFVTISRLEPPKAILAPFLHKKRTGTNLSSGGSIPRKSSAIVTVASSYKSYRIIVDLLNKKVESITQLKKGLQPLINLVDEEVAAKVIRKNQTILNRLKKLGLDLKLVELRASSTGPGFYDDPAYANRRIVQTFFSFRAFKGDNNFAHPLDFVAYIDLKDKEVIRIVDIPIYFNKSGPPLSKKTLPRKRANYSPLVLPRSFYRKRIPPLVTTTNGSPGQRVDLTTNTVTWDKFRFQFSFDGREGLVLHDISYNKRQLLYRASVSEMIVPYEDPRNPWQFKHPLDEGEYGLGINSNPLVPNSECNPDGVLVDAYVNNNDGGGRLIPKAICIHEEGGGILHTHTSSYGTTTARARVLNIFHVSTIGNYDYGFHWKLKQDATISVEITMTGLLATGLTLDEKTPYGTLVFPKINAIYHQHLFNVRLDTAFDGETNSVVIKDVVPPPDKMNPYGQGITTKATPLTSSLNSVTDTNQSTDRIWKIINPKSINPKTNQPVSWNLVPLNKVLLLAKPGSRLYRRGEFAAHSVWVTTYKDGEFYAGGEFPNQSPGGEGLPKYVKRNDSIVGTDIVLWYSFGATHIPRVEDFPIMPLEKIGFMLKPVNFFNSYPGLNIPPNKQFS